MQALPARAAALGSDAYSLNNAVASTAQTKTSGAEKWQQAIALWSFRVITDELCR
jgi:hypothetical protein